LRSRFSVQSPHHRAAETVDHARSGQRDQLHGAFLSRLESHRSSRGDIEAKAPRCRTIEGQRSVGFREMIMRADLDRPVARIRDNGVIVGRC
jgi:hypothetical protein